MASPLMPALGSNIMPITFHLSGAHTASVTGQIKFNAPFDMTVLYVTASIQAKSGTQGTTTLTLTNATNAFTNAMDLGTPAALTVVEATLVAAQVAVAKDAAVQGDLVITGGSTPSISNISVCVWVQRRG